MQSQVIPIRFKPDEKKMLTELAKRLDRNRSDTVRLLVREALTIIKEQDSKGGKNGLSSRANQSPN